MRVFRNVVLIAVVMSLIGVSPLVQADSENDWPVWNDWKRPAKRVCDKKSNTGMDQLVFRKCMAEALLRDFWLPEGLADTCKAQSPQSSVNIEQAKQLHECVVDLIVENAINRADITSKLNANPEIYLPVLKQCEDSYASSGVPFAQKWQHINDCVKKSMSVNR